MAAAVSNFSALNNLNSIIDSIELNIKYNLEKVPVLIYVGIGTVAGLIRREDDISILDDENYHQFPPALQQIYKDIPNLHIYCIYIDPYLENTPFVTQDLRMKQKMGWVDWKNNNDFCYENTRISVYPYRHSIIVNSAQNKYNVSNDYINITKEIDRLHKISIDNNITYLYHDFSGNDNIKYIEKYFNDSIKNNLNHIIYGLGNGSIYGCYYDFRKPEAHLPYIIENTPNRPMISVFNLNSVIDLYNINEYNKEIYGDFISFLNEIIESFGIKNIEIITSIMCNHINEFITKFKDYILYILRYFKDIDEKNMRGEHPPIDFKSYGFGNILDDIMLETIKNAYDRYSNNLLNLVVDMIAIKYKYEFNILGRKLNMNETEFLHHIINDPNKYNWGAKFHTICKV
jgi:hypothetical protein